MVGWRWSIGLKGASGICGILYVMRRCARVFPLLFTADANSFPTSIGTWKRFLRESMKLGSMSISEARDRSFSEPDNVA